MITIYKYKMVLKKWMIVLLLLANSSFAQTVYQKDFDHFWTTINDNYAYFKQQGIDWKKVKNIYTPLVTRVQSRNEFIAFLEKVIHELHNGHISLNTNLNSSHKLVPTGTDIYAEIIDGKYIITDLRKGFGAEACGLKTGMEIVKFNETVMAPQVKHFLPRFTDQPTASMYQYALSVVLAGTHDTKRRITVLENGVEKNFYPDSIKLKPTTTILDYRKYSNNVGYIRINNSLGNNDLINEFDKALDSLLNTTALILDLSETPSGGNSTVARAIMGRFINKTLPYQRHELDEMPWVIRRSWIEYVSPRKKTYTGKLIVLVGHWTSSMGEGIAIGFDGMKRAILIGTKMAGLIGAIDGFDLPETKIGFQFPTERLYHINGNPREDYKPLVKAKNIYDSWELVRKMLKIKE